MTASTAGRAPVHVGLRLEVEHRPVRVRRLGQVAAGGVQDALRLTRGARGVEDEQRVLGAERLRGVLAALPVDHVVPPHVAALGPGDVLAGAADDEDVLHVVHPGDGLVHGRLQGGRLAAPVAAVGGDDDPRVRVLDAGGERVGRETAEDDRVRGADAGAGQHRDGGLRDHRHVDGDPVALAHPELQQSVGRLGHLVLELGVGDGAAVARLALEVDRDPVAEPGLHVPVDAVVGDVELAVLEPLGERRVRPVEGLGGLLGPGQPAGLLGPEAEPVSLGLFIRLRGDVGVRGQVGGGCEASLLLQEVGQAFIAHGICLSQGVRCVPGHSSSDPGVR
ncbi:hypothetical protein STENM223S_03407 [Streptomyces tendae]